MIILYQKLDIIINTNNQKADETNSITILRLTNFILLIKCQSIQKLIFVAHHTFQNVANGSKNC
jgi:hypothetical protein